MKIKELEYPPVMTQLKTLIVKFTKKDLIQDTLTIDCPKDLIATYHLNGVLHDNNDEYVFWSPFYQSEINPKTGKMKFNFEGYIIKKTWKIIINYFI